MNMNIPLTASNGHHLNHAESSTQLSTIRDREIVSQMVMRMEKRIMRKTRKGYRIIKTINK
jgi:hypothetical protein